MTRDEIIGAYHGYIDCLNAQAWGDLDRFVADRVDYNGAEIGLAGYRAMLEGDFRAIPDLAFRVETFACDPPMLAVALAFDCHPVGSLFGLAVNGRRVTFGENVFYRFEEGRIACVRSIIDKQAVAAQL